MSTTSSSDEDDDFSKFASCAVSADQIEKDAQVEARKRVVRASQRPISSAARPAAASTHQQQQKGGSDEPTSTAGLDLVSVKVCTQHNILFLSYKLDMPGGGEAAAQTCWCSRCQWYTPACTEALKQQRPSPRLIEPDLQSTAPR
jgi:hypothetical protein